jgi:hypothetical protein
MRVCENARWLRLPQDWLTSLFGMALFVRSVAKTDIIAPFCCIYVFERLHGIGRRRIVGMDEKMVEAIARRAGLERALEAFPDDVAAAASSASKVTDRIRRSSVTPSSEPWPPMVVVRK